MAAIPFATVGFDLDGTLLDTHADLADAVNHALALGGFAAIPAGRARGLIGGGAKIMLARAIAEQGGVPDHAFRPLYKAMLAHYERNCAVRTVPFPGARAVLVDLRARGVALALVTNKFEGFARSILAQLDLAEPFAVVIGGDTLGPGRAKPAPDPLLEARARCGGGRFAYVGDSSYDVAAARGAGVPVVVAAYGYCDRPAAELGGDAVIDSLADLLSTLAGL